MATGFASIPFSIMIDSADLPGVEPNSEGAWTYTATIKVAGNTNWENLLAKWVRGVVVRPALGTSLGGAIISPGNVSAFGNLNIPANNGDEQVWRAILSEVRPLAILTTNIWRAQVVFICGDRVS